MVIALKAYLQYLWYGPRPILLQAKVHHKYLGTSSETSRFADLTERMCCNRWTPANFAEVVQILLLSVIFSHPSAKVSAPGQKGKLKCGPISHTAPSNCWDISLQSDTLEVQMSSLFLLTLIQGRVERHIPIRSLKNKRWENKKCIKTISVFSPTCSLNEFKSQPCFTTTVLSLLAANFSQSLPL